MAIPWPPEPRVVEEGGVELIHGGLVDANISEFWALKKDGMNRAINKETIAHMLHVWYIYLHLGDLWGKCW